MHLRFLIATICLSLPMQTWAATWAEKLGYPPDARVVILHANYMGSAYEFNRPGQELLEKGRVQSASLMVTCPWFEEFAAWCRQNPQYDVGVCLTLNSPGTNYRWRPLGGAESSSLIDADGYLWRTELQFAVRADIEQVAQEVDRQIEKARRAGVRPSHLIPFMGSLLTRPDLMKLYLQVAEENWIPAVMVEMTPENIDAAGEEGFALTDEMIQLAARYPLPKLDALHFVPEAESYEQKREKFYELIRDLPPGLTQIIAGPADRTAAIEHISPSWQLRVWENQLLSDDQVHQFLEQEGVVLTNWKEIMHRFETGAAPPPAAIPTANAPERLN
jgi:hypothetical protein